MSKKYIFFDIDGTLTNSNPGGIILPSTMNTLKKLEENGHFISIATGRNYTMAKETLEETGIKNAVCCGGNALVIDNKLQYVKPLDREKVDELIEECILKDIPFCIMKDDSDNMYTHSEKLINGNCAMKMIGNIQYVNKEDYKKFEEIHKVFILIPRFQENTIKSFKQLDIHYARYHDDHLVVEPDDKYQGIIDMIHTIGGNLDDVVVFGDGHNDLSMMKQAAISIAMGNAIDELKEIADFITKDCKSDGIEYACQCYGWI